MKSYIYILKHIVVKLSTVRPSVPPRVPIVCLLRRYERNSIGIAAPPFKPCAFNAESPAGLPLRPQAGEAMAKFRCCNVREWEPFREHSHECREAKMDRTVSPF